MSIRYRSELYKVIKALGDGAEIGVAEGRFSEEILKWTDRIFPNFYLVDRWKQVYGRGDGAFPQSWHDSNYEQMAIRIKPFGSRVTILRGESTEVAKYVPPNSLAFLYIDADHSY